MQVVNSLNNLTVDDEYFLDEPVVESNNSVPTGNIGLVGTFSRGPLNTPTLCTSYADLVKKFGDLDATATLTGPLAARGIFAQGNANVYVVRISSATTAATSASVVLDDTEATPAQVMTLTAMTPGTWGNSLTVTVSAGTKTGTFKVQLQVGTETETWDNLIIEQPGTPIVGAVLASTVFGTGATAVGQSLLAYATFPGTANANNWATGSFAMAGGTDGASTVATDYTGSLTSSKTGINALDSAPVNFVICAEQSDTTVNSALATNAENITSSGGTPRMAIITFPKSGSVSTTAALTNSMDSDRYMAFYPWVQVKDPNTGVNRTVSPLGYAVGLMAQLMPQQSPGNKQIYGVLGVDPAMNIGPSDIATLNQARINVIGLPTPAGKIGVRGGMTLSQTASTSPIYVRRMKDYIASRVDQKASIYVDQPITDALMRQLKQDVDNVLYPMKKPENPADQMVADYRITCDSSNNPPSVTGQDQLICDYAVKLLNMNRFEIFRTQVNPAVVISSN